MDAAPEVCVGEEFAGHAGAMRVIERLEKRNQARLEDAERRKEARESQAVAEEKGAYFSGTFNSERASIEELLGGCSGVERALAAQRLEEATRRTVQLQKFLNDSIVFLTSYELKEAQATLQKLQTRLGERREEALPKKKFAFRSRTNAADKDPEPKESTHADPALSSECTKVDGAVAPKQCGFSNMNNESLTKTAGEILKQDLLLSHLSNCKVRLFGSPSTLHLKHIDSCEILCGPVSTSVFVDQCTNSTLAFPCQQLRTHNTTDTQVYLHVTSRAIIEDCRGVSFAPFSWTYPTLDEDFQVSGLDQTRNNWNQVDDFNWLATGRPSPNWATIPEAERKTSWNP